MIFTLYYMYATLIQWWRLGCLKNKLNGTLNSRNALLICDEKVIYDGKKQRSFENLLFRRDCRIGCTIVPKQKINLTSQWVIFPKDCKYFPIFFKEGKLSLESPVIYVFLQAVLDVYVKHQADLLQIENFGELVAWKVTGHFEIILKSDLDKLTKLVHCFSQNDCDINHELQLLRIETVDVEGKPKKIKFERKFSLESTMKYSHRMIHWKNFVSEVKELYSKSRDATNPKITIDNGAAKSEESKKVPVSEVKPIKKDKKGDDKNTLEVNCSDYRRRKKETEKTSKTGKDHKKHKSKAELEQQNGHNKEEDAKPDLNHGSGKDKKLVRSAATCEPPEESERPKKGKPKEEKRKKHKLKSDKQEGGEFVVKRTKALNVLVYADSPIAKENVKTVLAGILNRDKYTIYDLPLTKQCPWTDSTALVVACGAVEPEMASNLIKFLLDGGQLLCLCSDLLYSVLHTFTTAEVREHELVRFSYGKWKRVKMMHHIFCYQASPAKKQFSKDSDTSNHSSGNGSSPVAPRTPSTVELQHNGKDFTIQVQVLGAEETWQTPSLLLATVKGSEGRAVFSQVHLEISPDEYEDDESKFEALKDSDQARLEILKDILLNHLDLDCDNDGKVPEFTPAYFLGRHDLKLKMLSECPNIKNNRLNAGALHITFCGKDDEFDGPSAAFLPVLIHACPQNFSTLVYFETLETRYIGRLVLYSDVLSSTQTVVNSGMIADGLAVIARRQVSGVGRSNNAWISPPGSAMFSLQLHVPLASVLGKVLPLVQHLIMVAVVSAIGKLTQGSKHIRVGIKWPNDLYADESVKIGGVMVTSTTVGDVACVNIGCGVNLHNSNPTTCINDLIRVANVQHNLNVPEISFEGFLASVFNQLEILIGSFQGGDPDSFYDLYYKYWLHNNTNVVITSSDGKSQKAKIVGIDDYGFLKIQTGNGKTSTVQPDGNSFDLMKGLIHPKNF